MLQIKQIYFYKTVPSNDISKISFSNYFITYLLNEMF